MLILKGMRLVKKLDTQWRAVMVAVLVLALLVVPNTVSYADVLLMQKPSFKTLVRIPVCEEGIGYTNALGRGYMEGPNAFEVQGSNIYVLDNVHNRVLKYDKNTGNLMDKISFPEDYWAYSLAVDSSGKIYLLDISAKELIVLVNGKIIMNRLEDVEIEPVAGFGVTEQGKIYVIRSGPDAMETLVLSLDSSGCLTTLASKSGTMAPDGVLWQVERSNESAKGSEISIHMSDFSKKLVFPGWLADPMSAINYLGKTGEARLFKVTTSENDLIVGLNDKTGNVEKLAIFPSGRYAFPNKDVSIDADGNVYLLESSLDEVSVLMVVSWPSLNEIPRLLSEKQATATIYEKEEGADATYIYRSQIMSTASAYHTKQWYCNRYNYEGTYADEPWQRPRYINQGYNTYYQFVPYCWGGFSSLNGFDSELSNNWAAGNINTTGNYKRMTTGVDCAGYVSRCWGLSSRRSTYGLMNTDVSLPLNNFAELKQGDILCNADHAMIFHYRDANGNYVLYESTKLSSYDRVAHTGRTKSSVESSYDPYRFKFLLDP